MGFRAVATAADRVEDRTGVIAPAHREPVLDGVRGLAMVLVLIWHYVQNDAARVVASAGSLTAALTGSPFNITWSGVDLFFILSGYLIAGQLIDNRESKVYFKTFYIRRALRIFPLYFLVLGTFFLIKAMNPLGLVENAPWLFAEALPAQYLLTFTQNIYSAATDRFGANWYGVTWSLALEEQFYLVLPLLIRLVPRRQLTWIAVSAIVAAPFVRIMLNESVGRLAPYILLLGRMDALAVGVLAAVMMRNPTVRELLERRAQRFSFGGIALLSSVAALASTGQPLFKPWMNAVGFSLLALGYGGLFLSVAAAPSDWAGRALSARPLTFFGLRAYGLYLIHQPVHGLVAYAITGSREPALSDLAGWLVIALATIVSLSLADLSWRYLEAPCISVGRRFAYFNPQDLELSGGPALTPGLVVEPTRAQTGRGR